MPEPTGGTRPARVYVILGFGLLSFTLSPILVRYASSAPGLTIAVWRTVLAVGLLLPWAVPRITDDVRRFTRREWIMIVAAGVLLGLHFITWIESIYHTTVASASVLVTTNPLFIAVLGFVFLGERLSGRVVVSVLLAVAGAALIGWSETATTAAPAPHPLLGNALALIAALVFSVYLLIGRVVRQRHSWLGYVFPLYVIVAVTTFVLALLLGTPLLGFDWTFYGLCLLMALGPSLLGHGSFNYAVRYFPVALLAVLGLLEPVGASLLAFILFDEVPSLLAIGGMVLVLVGVGAAVRRGQVSVPSGAPNRAAGSSAKRRRPRTK